MESQRSEVKECFTRATTRHNSKQSNIHHTSSPELSFSLVFYSLCYRISGSTSSLLARQSRRFFKNITTHIYSLVTPCFIWIAMTFAMGCGPKLLSLFFFSKPKPKPSNFEDKSGQWDPFPTFQEWPTWNEKKTQECLAQKKWTHRLLATS